MASSALTRFGSKLATKASGDYTLDGSCSHLVLYVSDHFTAGVIELAHGGACIVSNVNHLKKDDLQILGEGL